MKIQYRIDLLDELGRYILSGDPAWLETLDRAGLENGWFIPEFSKKASETVAKAYLKRDLLTTWLSAYPVAEPDPASAPLTGIVMAGNIPLVGFHDFLCGFAAGNRLMLKPSSKDQVLIRHLTDKLISLEPAVAEWIGYSEMLKGCDRYIATGSNNSSRYFDYYFRKYPHIIRRNRTSVAILDGTETAEELDLLADDVHLYFGLGCRNVTKLYVPAGYDFVPLLETFRKYSYFSDHHKFRNNYDYNLALHVLNKKFYMTNGTVLLSEEASLFSPISQLNYEYYTDAQQVAESLRGLEELQAVVGHGRIPFGKAQEPSLTDYADGVDTMAFLTGKP